ncbi:putative ArsR family transcriptional regulator [Microbacterium resistens]|uniref:ArsR family transcriptional regulator n=1 Tax=Microbacterium resistens TaxID=156977 RepID=A0ABU1S9P2_9MICO|nr:helix-turn-helix domain-containing protein [Microbacterium resistens]MDR6866335.1 putative ArsR family transcriptional regulator [Microbacterium resistens]
MPRRAHDFRALTQPTRMRLLHAVQRDPGRHADELATAIDVPLNTVRDHLRVLVEEGFVHAEPEHRPSRGRPPLGYHPVRDVTASAEAAARVDGARRRGELLRAVTGERLEETDAERPQREQLDVLYEHFEDAGLQPTIDERSLVVDLVPCRYYDQLDEDRAVVCAVHARLATDVLRQAGGPLALRRVEPFVAPHRCRLTLGAAPSSGSPEISGLAPADSG